MQFKPANNGLLNPTMVKDGDKIILIEEAYSTFVEKKQTTYWNAKVQLPDGSHKLASLFDSTCEEMSKKWGTDTAGWVGHTLVVKIKNAKTSGNPYVFLTPTDDEVVAVAPAAKKEDQPAPADKLPTIQYPTDDIHPDDIPF